MARTRTWTLAGALLGALLLAGAVAQVASAYTSQLRRYPYLTDAVAGGVTVNWATDQSFLTGSVTWGVGGAEPCTAHTTTATRTTVNVNGVLEYQWSARLAFGPNTTFCYRVFGAGVDLLGTDASPQSITQLPAGSIEPYSFAVFGDWGQGLAAGNPGQAGVMRQMAASGARFALSTGDIGYPSGNQANYGDLVQTGVDNISGVFAPDAWTQVGNKIPLFSPTGNHGFNTTFPSMWPSTNAAAASGGFFGVQTYCCTNGTSSASYPSAWYAFDQGNARFYVLEASWADTNVGTATDYQNDYDNHWTPSSPEYQWLQNDLSTHPSQLKFAVWHYPLYSDNSSERSNTLLQGPGSLEGLLNRYGVDLGFNGHAHIYQRNNAAPNGLVTYITGGGGAQLLPIDQCSPIDAYGIGWANSAGGSGCGAAAATPPTSASQVFHFLLVTVDGTHVTVTPIDSNGNTFDVQSYDFPNEPGAPPDTTPPGPPPATTPPLPPPPAPPQPAAPTPAAQRSTSGPAAPSPARSAAVRRSRTTLTASFRTVSVKKATRAGHRGTRKRSVIRFVDGRLTTDAGQALAGQAVELQTRPRVVGSRWQTTGSGQTDAQGRLSFSVAQSPSLYVRLMFAQTTALAAARSLQLETQVRARSTIAVNRRTARNGQTARFSGRLLGGFLPRRGRDVEFQRYDSARRRWIRVPTGILLTDAKGRWHGAYRFKIFRRRQAVKFRLRMPTRGDVPFAEGFSRTVSVTVTGR